jgi:hypothetical protein
VADCCFGYSDDLPDALGPVASNGDDVFCAVGDDPDIDRAFPLAGSDFLEQMSLQ